jgi:hypothetical protein
MPQTLGTGWLNSNLLRNYPLSQSATLQSYNSSLKIPDDLLVDLKLHVPYITQMAAYNFYISSITIYPQGMSFSIGYEDTSGYGESYPVVAVSAPVAFNNFTEYSTVALTGVNQFFQVNGIAVIGKISSIQGVYGTSDFNLVDGRLESCTVSFGPRRVSGLVVSSASGTTSVLSGKVVLQSGANHAISAVQVSGNYQLTFNAIDGAGLEEECACSGIELPPCIRTINNVSADVQGNINIVGGDCVKIDSSQTATISVADSCAKPCCGCNELQVLVDDIDTLKGVQIGLASQIGVLGGGISGLQQNCLGSSLDPSSCASDGV